MWYHQSHQHAISLAILVIGLTPPALKIIRALYKQAIYLATTDLDPFGGGPYPNLHDEYLNGWTRLQIQRVLERAEARLYLHTENLLVDNRSYSVHWSAVNLTAQAIEKAVRADELLPSLVVTNLTAVEKRIFGGSVKMDDPELILHLRRMIPKINLEKTSRWRTPSLAQDCNNTVAVQASAWLEKELGSKWNKLGPIEDPLLKAFFEKVGGIGGPEACLSKAILTAFPQSKGLVVEMDRHTITRRAFTQIAPMCVSPSSMPKIMNMKTFIKLKEQMAFNGSFLPENGKTKHEHMPYTSTILPFRVVAKSRPWREMINKDKVVLKMIPVKCFPLYSIMLAANLTDVKYLGIMVSGGMAADIAKTLPWGKMKPNVVQLAEVPDNSDELQAFMAGHGYHLAANFTSRDGSKIFTKIQTIVKKMTEA